MCRTLPNVSPAEYQGLLKLNFFLLRMHCISKQMDRLHFESAKPLPGGSRHTASAMREHKSANANVPPETTENYEVKEDAFARSFINSF